MKFTYPLAVFSDPREPDIPIPLRHPQESTLMSNPAYGYSNVPERWAVRISDNGEFIHQNQYTVADQGVVNVSHGCINLSAESAQAYFESAIYGDPVQVTGTSVQLSADDGDIYDWALTWDQWKAIAAPDHPRLVVAVTALNWGCYLGVRSVVVSGPRRTTDRPCRCALINRSCSEGSTDTGRVNDVGSPTATPPEPCSPLPAQRSTVSSAPGTARNRPGFELTSLKAWGPSRSVITPTFSRSRGTPGDGRGYCLVRHARIDGAGRGAGRR